MLKYRYLTPYIVDDLKEKMVFVSGPRQVGKTTLSRELVAKDFKTNVYLSWDYKEDRELILDSQWPADAELIILDEIHKYKKWKTLLKGSFDKFKHLYKFLVTGSARLNIFRKGGDSLQGRYHHFRLHPFSLAEYSQKKNTLKIMEELTFPSHQADDEFATLYHFGGFPEPLIKQNERLLRRWHREKIERLFREDIRETEQIRDLGSMQILADLLPGRVGSLLSINALREDLEVSFRTASHWLDILEIFYYHFRISPFSSKGIRSLKKEPKLYLWDWSEITDDGKRFENCVASHLLKMVNFLQDYEGYDAKLHFLRDRDKREVDFLVVINNKPWFACEAKLQDGDISQNLIYFKERLKIPFVYQVVKNYNKDVIKNGIRTLPAAKFLAGLV
jgi:uncharacterized protein